MYWSPSSSQSGSSKISQYRSRAKVSPHFATTSGSDAEKAGSKLFFKVYGESVEVVKDWRGQRAGRGQEKAHGRGVELVVTR